MIKKIFMRFQKERDLTTISISKGIWVLAIPMIFSNLLQAAFNLVDMIWVGRLGAPALAAVAMSGQILMIVMFLMIGVGTGTTAMVARAIGERKQGKANNAAMQSLIMGFAGSIFFAVIGYFLSPWFIKVLGASPEVVRLGTGYLQITFMGVIVIFFMFLISAILQGAGDAATPMVVLAIATVINIILDPFMIFGIGFFPRLGVNGAAWATVIARAIGAAIALEVLLRGRSRVHVRIRRLRTDLDTMWRILKIGIPSSTEMTLRGLVGIVLYAVVAGFGTYAVAAYGVGVRLFMISIMPGFALGMAAGTMVGQNLGAEQPDRAVRSAWTTVAYYSIFMFAMTVILFIFAPYLMVFFNRDLEVVRIGTNFIRITSLGNIFIAFSLILNRSLSGAGETVPPMIFTFTALWLVQIPLSIILSRIPFFGINGIWIAILTAYFVQGALVTFWFQLGRWKTKRV